MSNKKISKSHLGPDYEARVNEAMAKPKAVSMHFALGTYVRCNGVRGLIVGKSAGSGRELFISWEDGRQTTIDNPNCVENWRGRYGSSGG